MQEKVYELLRKYSHLTFENTYLSTEFISKKLNENTRKVSRALSKLEKFKIVKRVRVLVESRQGKKFVYCYSLNGDFDEF